MIGWHHDTDDVLTPEVLDAAARACQRYGLRHEYTDPNGAVWILIDARGFHSRAAAQAYNDWFVQARRRAGLPVGGATIALERNLPPQGQGEVL